MGKSPWAELCRQRWKEAPSDCMDCGIRFQELFPGIRFLERGDVASTFQSTFLAQGKQAGNSPKARFSRGSHEDWLRIRESAFTVGGLARIAGSREIRSLKFEARRSKTARPIGQKRSFASPTHRPNLL